MRDDPSCVCGISNQTMKYILIEFPSLKFGKNQEDLKELNNMHLMWSGCWLYFDTIKNPL